MGKVFQGEKKACAKGLWSERTWHVGGTSEALVWLKEVSEGAVIKRKIIKGAHAGHIRSLCSLFIYLFIYGCAGSSTAACGFSLIVQSRVILHCSEQASHCSSFSCHGAQALGAWASGAAGLRLSSCGQQGPTGPGPHWPLSAASLATLLLDGCAIAYSSLLFHLLTFQVLSYTVYSHHLDSSLQPHLLSLLTLAHLLVSSLGIPPSPHLVPLVKYSQIILLRTHCICNNARDLMNSMSNLARDHLSLIHYTIPR